jgi:hypothetical protein
MKRVIIVIVIAIAAGVCSFAWMRAHRMAERESTSLLEDMPELGWLRNELSLTDSQFEKVSELHAAYRPKCEEMCRQIAEAHGRLEATSHGQKEITPELRAVIEEHAQLHAECQEKMLIHLYETAGVMNENQAERYLELMLPYALDFSHSEPDDIHGK